MANYIVSIFCGHSKYDTGASYGNLREAVLMLPITKEAVRIMRAQKGVTVHTDVDPGEDNYIDMTKQVEWSNSYGADVHVALHCDWYKAPTGTLPLYYPNSSAGKRLAQCINKHVMADCGMTTRGLSARGDLYELSATKMTACIFECGSIRYDADEWDTSAECTAWGRAIAKGICEYLGIAFVDPDGGTSTKVDDEKLDEDGLWGKDTSRNSQKLLGTPIDGIISGQLKEYVDYLPNCLTSSWEFNDGDGSDFVYALQGLIGAKQDYYFGPKSAYRLQVFLKDLGLYDGELDKIVGKLTVTGWQKYVNSKL